MDGTSANAKRILRQLWRGLLVTVKWLVIAGLAFYVLAEWSRLSDGDRIIIVLLVVLIVNNYDLHKKIEHLREKIESRR